MTKAIRTYTISYDCDENGRDLRDTMRLTRREGFDGLVWVAGDIKWGDVVEVCPPAKTVKEAMANAAAIWPSNSTWRGRAGSK